MSANERIRSTPQDEPDLGSEEHDAWFKAEVQKALDDPRPGIPHEDVMRKVRAMIDSHTRR
ncbi:MAG: hypothetical protein WA414_17825 [Acidobacteriaceae bacterium]